MYVPKLILMEPSGTVYFSSRLRAFHAFIVHSLHLSRGKALHGAPPLNSIP